MAFVDSNQEEIISFFESENIPGIFDSETISNLRQMIFSFNPKYKVVPNGHLRAALFGIDPYYISYGKQLLGTSVETLLAASKSYNFTYTLKTTPIRFIQLPNKTWTGIMGDLIQGNVDIFFGMAVSLDRSHYIDYGTIGLNMDLTFITGHPR
ncbi:unnamed protein product, partial [Allacma fusca]